MPALLERPAPAPPRTDSPTTPAAGVAPVVAPVRTCSGCFLTETALRETGLLGCARCYETFAPQIARAAEALHGVRPIASSEPTAPRRVTTNPWPTRRAVAR